MKTERITTRAPGKIILGGEHAVVYGCPAIATAVDRHVTCRVERSGTPDIQFHAPSFCRPAVVPLREASAILRRLNAAYDDFLAGRRGIREVLEGPVDLLVFAVMRALDRQPSTGLKIELATDIPVGCGMGSSAAVAVALISAIRHIESIPCAADDLFRAALDCERLQHGHPSGIDPHASTYGGCFLFRRDHPVEPLPPPSAPLLLAHTGEPACSTGECVVAVRKNHGASDIWKAFNQTCEKLHAILETQADFPRPDAPLKAVVQQNHRLLAGIGVVPPRAQKLIEAVEQAGGAAKICGAGAVRGENGGMVWILLDTPEAEAVCAAHDVPLLQIRGGTGVASL